MWKDTQLAIMSEGKLKVHCSLWKGNNLEGPREASRGYVLI